MVHTLGNRPVKAIGAFSKVYFLHTLKFGVQTFTKRQDREGIANDVLCASTNSFAGGVMFAREFVKTSIGGNQ